MHYSFFVPFQANVYSGTGFRLECCDAAYSCDLSDIDPEDVETKDSVTFIWEIL